MNLKLVSLQGLIQLAPNCEKAPAFNLAQAVGGLAPVWSAGGGTHIWAPHGCLRRDGSQQGEKK